MCLGEKLKKLRAHEGKTQQEIADMVGVAKSTYSLYESGKREPNVCTLKKIAMALNTTGDILLSLEEPTEQKGTPQYDLSEEHKSLLSLYNCCSESGQQRILAFANNICEMEKAENAVEPQSQSSEALSNRRADLIARALRVKSERERASKTHGA